MDIFPVAAPLRRVQPIRVDTSAITEDGLLRVRRARFGANLPAAGRKVFFVDPVNEVRGMAFMVNQNVRTGLVYLDVQWDSVEDAPALDAYVEYGFARGVAWSAPERAVVCLA